MRDQTFTPEFARPTPPSAPVMRANATDSLAASVASPSLTPSQKKRPQRRARGYTTVWASAGVLAAAYAGAVLVRQEPLTAFALRWSAQESDTTEMAAALARTQSEVAQLQRSVGSLEGDMGRVKAQTAQVEQRERATGARVDALETRVERIGAQIGQAVAKGAPQLKGAPGPVAAARPPGAAIETGALPGKETPSSSRELAAARYAAPVVAAPLAAPNLGAVPQPSPASAGILLARGPSLDALRLSWSLLNERHKSSLGALEPRVVTTEPGTHQLVAGPFASSADAAKACATLKSRGVTCQPAEFRGEGL